MRSRSNRGLTFVELMVVIALIAILFAGGVLVSMQAFQSASRRSERDVLVGLLQRARSRAMANVNQQRWGVCLDTTVPANPQYILFSGVDYGSAIRKESVTANAGVTINSTAAPSFPCVGGGIIFTQLSANTSNESIVIHQGAITNTITTNAFGRISW